MEQNNFRPRFLAAGGGHDVEIAVVRCACLLQHGVLVELSVRCRVVTAVKGFLVRFLFSVVGKRLTRNLSATQPATIGERGEINRVHRGFLLKEVEHRFDAFVHKRHCAHLNAVGYRRRRLGSGKGGLR
jgi:hypothetical protein